MKRVELTAQYRQQAEELRTLAAYMLRVAADYDRLASTASMFAESPKVLSEPPNAPQPA
jgi:hypothetical protein